MIGEAEFRVDKLKQRLLELLFEQAFRYSPDQPFTLASGRMSPYYIDCRKVTFTAEGAYLVGQVFFQLVKDLEKERGVKIAAVGGPGVGAIPIASAVACYSYLQQEPIQAFSVRKEPKGHGLQKWVEGYDQPGSRVVIVDDVVTTGESTLKAIEGATNAGFKIEGIIVLVDRQEGGGERLREEGLPFTALFTSDNFMKLHRERA